MDIRTIRMTPGEDPGSVAGRLREPGTAGDAVDTEVEAVLRDVRKRGDEALVELTRELDGVSIGREDIEVPARELESALASIEPSVRNALEKAYRRVARFARASMPAEWSIEQAPGLSTGQVLRPLEPVGVYVPGGRYPYPSTVLMTAGPAKVAGVESLVLCSPPTREGSVSAAVLAAAALVGGCRVFRVGGAQAIAAMAYGTETIPRCRMISGPGNVYVTAAKRKVSLEVKVDLEAGPSEIAVICDRRESALAVSCDLIAQVEHDPFALAVALAYSPEVLSEIRLALETEGRGVEGGVDLVLCADLEACLELADELAPEHLELVIEDPESSVASISTAGCVFLGEESGVAFGDYLAGPSHVLPTGGAGRMRSGLQASDFTRTMNVVSYSREAGDRDREDAVILARLEGLERHARSLEVRAGEADGPTEV